MSAADEVAREVAALDNAFAGEGAAGPGRDAWRARREELMRELAAAMAVEDRRDRR